MADEAFDNRIVRVKLGPFNHDKSALLAELL